jgi:hypothetical protein
VSLLSHLLTFAVIIAPVGIAIWVARAAGFVSTAKFFVATTDPVAAGSPCWATDGIAIFVVAATIGPSAGDTRVAKQDITRFPTPSAGARIVTLVIAALLSRWTTKAVTTLCTTTPI